MSGDEAARRTGSEASWSRRTRLAGRGALVEAQGIGRKFRDQLIADRLGEMGAGTVRSANGRGSDFETSWPAAWSL